MPKKNSILIASIVLALFVGWFGKFITSHPNLSLQVGVEQKEIYETSRIWSRGPTGDAAENATHHFKKHGHEFGFISAFPSHKIVP